MKFIKLDVSNTQYLSAYEVWDKNVKLGVVWSRRGFSYRGEQGWNRGIRIRDYHPTEWQSGQTLGITEHHRITYMSRKYAVNALLKT